MAAICVFCGSSRVLSDQWLSVARLTGAEVARRGHTLVWGGARVGMMGVVASAARAGGAATVGVMAQSLVGLEIADHDAAELLVTPDLAARKTAMIEKSDGFVVLPGGLGTLDELFEVWTLGMLGESAAPVVLLDVDGYYSGLLSWLTGSVESGFVRRAALDLLVVVNSVPAALDAIEASLG